jgi:hypothetical protein
MKRLETIGERDDRHIIRSKASGQTAATPALALALAREIILPLLAEFCFTGPVCEFLRGMLILEGLNSDVNRLHS